MYEQDYSMFSGSTIPPSLVKKTTSVGSPGPARLTAVTFAENGTKAPEGLEIAFNKWHCKGSHSSSVSGSNRLVRLQTCFNTRNNQNRRMATEHR